MFSPIPLRHRFLVISSNLNDYARKNCDGRKVLHDYAWGTDCRGYCVALCGMAVARGSMGRFITLASLWIIAGLPLIVRVLSDGRETVSAVIRDAAMQTLLGIGISFLLGCIVGSFWKPVRLPLAGCIAIVWMNGVVTTLRDKIKGLKLESDLQKPREGKRARNHQLESP
jgi:hypothetical protein